MFDTVLVANRGEIACRVIRTARARGYRTVAVFSAADAGAPHVAMADRAVFIGDSEAKASYLDPARILEAARRTGAQAIHPGYGFLSENADFARACGEAGLVFIGPPPDAIDAMGDKARSKVIMRAHGVPTVPGFDADDPSDDDLIAAAEGVGYPLLVKASAGGGGRGMRVVSEQSSLRAALASARAEAEASFGAGTLLLERLVTGARHVEVQVMADAHGHVVHLGERDCSVQRRHQKVIEEAPSPAVDATLRAAMGEAACRAAAAVGYQGAGTVEFLLAPDGAFYFLEMNTRLQVEHPVTEAVTGFDLVAWQLDVAEGRPLPVNQDQVRLRGHAIEARLYAEDPAQGFLPQTGRLVGWRPSDRVRIDHGVEEGQEISPFYDPMLAKVVAWGEHRDMARRLLIRALAETVTLGLTTNRRFLARVLCDEDFIAGQATTRFLDERPALQQEAPVSSSTVALAARLFSRRGDRPLRIAHPASQPLALAIGGERREVRLEGDAVVVGAERLEVVLASVGRARVDGVERGYTVVMTDDAMWLAVDDDEVEVRRWVPTPKGEVGASDGMVRSPMAARVIAVHASVGDAVEAGAVLAVLEAMKIETRLLAPVAGRVVELRVAAGRSVARGDVVARIETEGE